jgi:phytol kinase
LCPPMDFIGALSGLLEARNWLLYAPPAVAVLGLGALLAGWLKLKKGVKTNYTRKVFHILNFTYAAAIYVIGGTVAVLIFGGLGIGAMIIAMFLKDGNILLEGLAREQDAPHRKFYVIMPFIATAVAGVLDNILMPRFAVVGYLVSGWGDAAGEPVGVRWGKHRYKVRALYGVACTRSLEGSAGVFFVSWAGAFIALLIARVAWLPAIPISLAAAGVAALVEAVSNHGLDNLTVQMTAAAVAYGLSLAAGLA